MLTLGLASLAMNDAFGEITKQRSLQFFTGVYFPEQLEIPKLRSHMTAATALMENRGMYRYCRNQLSQQGPMAEALKQLEKKSKYHYVY